MKTIDSNQSSDPILQ